MHVALMAQALALADQAVELGEVPIAALVARGDGKVVGRGWNELKAKRDPTLHAELAAFRDAAGRYPTDATDLILVSTLEPCVMCYGAALLTGVQTIVYALAAPADAGIARIKPPTSPGLFVPRTVGPIATAEMLERFRCWLDTHPSDDPQTAYVQQLVDLHDHPAHAVAGSVNS